LSERRRGEKKWVKQKKEGKKMGEETIDRKPFKKALTEMEMKSFFFFVDTRAAAHTRLSFNFFFLLLC
jgi:hypothetical protein